MRIVPTWLHGMLDYLVSVMVMALPFVFGWQGGARWAYVALGLLGIVYSLITDYEWGAVHLLSMPVHLALDTVFGAAMLITPAIIDVPRFAWISIVIGLLALVLSAITQRQRGGLGGAVSGEAS